MSYNALFSFVVGARSVGKTFQFKYYRIREFIKKSRKTFWIMRYRKELDSALESGKFFEDVSKFFPECEFRVKGNIGSIKIDNEWFEFITFKALSETSIKAVSDPDVDMIVFDEFIPIPSIRHLPGEVEKFLELYFTISRDRDIRAVFLANNVTISSPYFSYFHIKLPEKGQIISLGEIAIENVKNPTFKEHMEKTRFGRLISGTKYSSYAISNETFVDLDTFVLPMPSNAKCVVNLRTDVGSLYLWVARPASLFISHRGCDCAIEWAVGENSHGENMERVDFAGSYARKLISANYRVGTLFFDSKQAKADFMQTCQKLLGTK